MSISPLQGSSTQSAASSPSSMQQPWTEKRAHGSHRGHNASTSPAEGSTPAHALNGVALGGKINTSA
jgi:hypothetical protein